MSSARVVILCSLLLGSGALGCAQSPLRELDESDLRPLDPDDGDDDVDDMKNPVRVDDDDSDDDGSDDGPDVDPPAKPRDAGPSSVVDSGPRDAAVPDSAPDAGEDAPRMDASAPLADASTPPVIRDAASPVTTDASAPARDATTPSAPADAGTTPAVSACRAGTYRGALSGEILDGSARSRVTGTVTMVLGSTGTSLRVQTGTFEGKDAAGQTFTARVNAVLNCATSRLENGSLDEGVYNAREGIVSPIRFSGSIGGALGAGPTVQGDWRWESALRSRSARGTFSATLEQ